MFVYYYCIVSDHSHSSSILILMHVLMIIRYSSSRHPKGGPVFLASRFQKGDPDTQPVGSKPTPALSCSRKQHSLPPAAQSRQNRIIVCVQCRASPLITHTWPLPLASYLCAFWLCLHSSRPGHVLSGVVGSRPGEVPRSRPVIMSVHVPTACLPPR